MTPEWYLMLIKDLQELWKLFNHYLTAPGISNGMNAAVLLELVKDVWNQPLRILVMVLSLLMVGGSLLACQIAIACDSHSERKELAKRRFVWHKMHHEKTTRLTVEPIIERGIL